MRGTRLVLGIGLVVAALALAGCGGDDDDSTATDTDTVTETTDTTETTGEAGGDVDRHRRTWIHDHADGRGGRSVSTLPAGSYTIEVDDQSDMHNFHLTGPGVEETTDVARGRNADVGRHARSGDVHVRLRSACELDERELHGHLAAIT